MKMTQKMPFDLKLIRSLRNQENVGEDSMEKNRLIITISILYVAFAKESHFEKDCWFKGNHSAEIVKNLDTEISCHLKQTHQANFFEEADLENNFFYVYQAASKEKKDT